jgi:hypothetical protein
MACVRNVLRSVLKVVSVGDGFMCTRECSEISGEGSWCCTHVSQYLPDPWELLFHSRVSLSHCNVAPKPKEPSASSGCPFQLGLDWEEDVQSKPPSSLWADTCSGRNLPAPQASKQVTEPAWPLPR